MRRGGLELLFLFLGLCRGLRGSRVMWCLIAKVMIGLGEEEEEEHGFPLCTAR